MSGPKLALLGMMGAGKSLVGAELHRRRDYPFADLDREIEKAEGRTIAEIFASDGEEAFRRIESDRLARVCGSFDGVLATGGGIVLAQENRDLLRRWGTTVYLRAAAVTLAERLLGDENAKRPLLAGSEDLESRLGAILAAREALYAGADHVLDTDALSPGEVCERVAALIPP